MSKTKIELIEENKNLKEQNKKLKQKIKKYEKIMIEHLDWLNNAFKDTHKQ